MANLLRTERTYKTYANAEKALEKILTHVTTVAFVNTVKVSEQPMTLSSARYLIAATPDGRFAPVLVGQQYIQFAVNAGITVVG